MANKNSKLKTVLGVIAGVLVVALIAGLFIYTKLGDSGFFLRHTVSLKSENYEVNNAQMSYFFSTNYTSAVSSNSSTYEYYGLDTTKALKDQQYPGGGTWYDYFMQSVTVPSVQQMLILCEAARAEGYELTEDDRAEIDEAIAGIESSAKEAGYTTDYYVMNYYGVGVKLKDVRGAMEISQLAYSYYEHVMDSFSFTETEWDIYYNEHIDDFQKIDYLAYTFVIDDIAHLNDEAADETEASTETEAVTEAVTETSDADTSDADTADTDTADTEEDEHAHEEYKPIVEGYAAELASKSSAEDFVSYIETFLSDVMYASEDDATKETSIAEDMETVEATGVVYSSEDETLVELFKLAEGKTYTEVDQEKGEYTVYYITAPKYHDEYTTKDAYMIMLSGTSDEVTADLDEINAALKEDSSAEKFVELAKEYSVDTATAQAGALYDNIGKTDFTEETMVDWLFSDERAAGDYEVFSTSVDDGSTTTSSTVYYYVVMYKGDGMVKWQYDANEALRAEAYEAKYAEFETAHGGDKLSVDLNELYKIPN